MKYMIMFAMFLLILSCGTIKPADRIKHLTTSNGLKYVLIIEPKKHMVVYESVNYFCNYKDATDREFAEAEFDFGFVATGLVLFKINNTKYRCGLEPELEIFIEEDQ